MKNSIINLNEREIVSISGGDGGLLSAFVLGAGYVAIGVASYFYGKYARARLSANQEIKTK